jgi:hypothetical protein
MPLMDRTNAEAAINRVTVMLFDRKFFDRKRGTAAPDQRRRRSLSLTP